MMLYTMQVVLVAFAAVVLGVGILATNPEDSVDLVPESKVLAEKTVHTTASPLATPTVQPVSNTLSEYVYPGSATLSSSADKLELESSDNADTITDWYRNKVKAKGFSITSSVKTSTNGVVNNKLVAAEGGSNVEISVTRNSGNLSSITVNIN